MEQVMRGRITSPPTPVHQDEAYDLLKGGRPLEAEAWIKAIKAKFSAFCATMLRGKQGQLRSSATAGRNFDVVGPFQDYAVRACGHLE
jgi:hypothetical protein